MATVKMGYVSLTVPEQVERTRLIQSMMTGNADYATPSPPLAVMGTAAMALETAYNESCNRDKIKTAAMRERRKELLRLVLQLAAYVQDASAGDAEKILGSGFFVRQKGSPKPDTAGTVTNLRLGDGLVSGSLRADWIKASNAVNYVVEVATTSDFSDAKFAGVTTRTQKELTGFEPGKTIWVRVQGIGKENPGTACGWQSILVR